MKKINSLLKRTSWILFILGALLVAGALVLDYLFLEYRDLIFFGSIAGFALIILVWLFSNIVISYKMVGNRNISDLKASHIIGSDVEAAYNFGEIGLIVTDENGTVLWISDLLIDRGFNFIDKNVRDIDKAFGEFFGVKKKENSSFVFNDKCYDVKFLKAANLFILKDTTKFENALVYSDNQSLVLGYISVDNFSDIPSTDEYGKSQIISDIRRVITEYFKNKDTVLKVIDDDFYFFLMTKKKYKSLMEDKFSLVGSFASSFEKIGLTLSIGVGFGAEDYTKINELASSALDVALSRGGNQCVIYPFGANMVFLGGGNSESRFSTSKVKIKTFARSFAASLANQTNVLIVPHNYADVDAIGACLGVYTICKSINNSINARIIYSDEAVEKTADLAIRTMLPSYFFDEVFVSFKTANEIKKKDALIVVVDHNKPELSIYPELYLGGDNKIAIIDHHRKTDDAFDSVVFEHIDSSASSTCELLSLYFDSYSFKMNISSEIATLMLAGIYLDTTNFKMHTSIGTHEASIILSRLGADEVKARDLLKESYETFAVKSKIISSLEMPENGVIIVKAPEEDLVNTTLLAIVCNELRDVQGTQVCFAIGKTSEDDVNISSRSDGSVNCELLMQKLGGGGHFSAAACKLENVTIEEAENKLKHVLDEYLKDAMSSDRKHEDEGE